MASALCLSLALALRAQEVGLRVRADQAAGSVPARSFTVMRFE